MDNLEAFLDIETTGFSADCCEITVVGIYLTGGGSEKVVQLVGHLASAENIMEALHGAGRLYTYNGSRFDLPFIKARQGLDLEASFSHCDLMYHCWRRQLRGGLKKVEERLGIARETRGVDGQEAVRLWWRYVNDYDQSALELLLKYNKEDIVNLKYLKDKLLDSQT